jgi:hypothetical protein
LLIKDELAGLGDDVVMISIDGDPNENADLLRRYADQMEFDWHFAVAPREVMSALAGEYGSQFLYPPSEPMFAVSAKSGDPIQLEFGHKDEADLRAAVERARSE